MPRIKRAMRQDGDDAPTEGTPPAPTSPPAVKKGKDNPFTKWFIAVGVFLLVIIGLPSLIWAQTQTVQVDQGSIAALQQKIAEVQTMVQSIINGPAFTNQTSGGLNSLSTTCTSRGCLSCHSDRNRNRCVNKCIWGTEGILACIASIPGQTVTEDTATELFSPISLQITAAQALTPTYASCVKAGNLCFTTCEADMPCEDRAAAWYDACISWVETTITDPAKNAAAKAKCGQIDRQLILQYCGKQGLLEPDLSPDFCADQCCRVQSICSASMLTYSLKYQAMCQKLGDECRTKGCPGGIPVCKYDNALCSAYLEKAKAGDATAREQLKQCTHCQIGCTDAQLAACSDNYAKSAEAGVAGVDAMMTGCLSTCSWPSGGQCTAEQVSMCNDNYLKYAEAGAYTDVVLNDMKNMCLRDCAWPTTGCTQAQLDVCKKNLMAGPAYVISDKTTLYAYQPEYDSCIQTCTWPTVSCKPEQITMCQDSYKSAVASASVLVNLSVYDTMLQSCYKTCQWPSPSQTGTVSCTEQQLADCQMWNADCLAAVSADKCSVVNANCQASCKCTYDQLKSCFTNFMQEMAMSMETGKTVNAYNPATYANCTAACAPKMFQSLPLTNTTLKSLMQ